MLTHDNVILLLTTVFSSWNNPRAVRYRAYNQIANDSGTAVNVQAMVFGNLNNNCGTGVGFTRNPATGENTFFGEFLINAQGEDVVAGIRTPESLNTIREKWPDIYSELFKIRDELEKQYRNMQGERCIAYDSPPCVEIFENLSFAL